MKTISNKKIVIKGDPELSSREKLEQIRTGKKIKRTKGSLENKKVIMAQKSGMLITAKETKETFEESEVKRRKRNYVMYESKIGSERNLEITKFLKDQPKAKPKPKPKREVVPRIEEKIVTHKKRREYLDNYKYLETKVIKDKNPRKQVLVKHERLGDIVGGFYETKTYQRTVTAHGLPNLNEKSSTITVKHSRNPRFIENKSNLRNARSTSGRGPKSSRSPSPLQDAINSATIINESTKNPQLRGYKTEKRIETFNTRTEFKNRGKGTIKNITIDNSDSRNYRVRDNKPVSRDQKRNSPSPARNTISKISITNVRNINTQTRPEGKIERITSKREVKTPYRRPRDNSPINNKSTNKTSTNWRHTENHQKVKSEIITNKIMTRKEDATKRYETSTEVKYNRNPRKSPKKFSEEEKQKTFSGKFRTKKESFGDNEDLIITNPEKEYADQTISAVKRLKGRLSDNISKQTEIKIEIETLTESKVKDGKKNEVVTKSKVIKINQDKDLYNNSLGDRSSIRKKYKFRK